MARIDLHPSIDLENPFIYIIRDARE